MISFEGDPHERQWRPDLSDFFDLPKDHSNRVAGFLDDVEYVKGLLAQARQFVRSQVPAVDGPVDGPVNNPTPVSNPAPVNNPALVNNPAPVNNPLSVNGLVDETEPDLYSADG